MRYTTFHQQQLEALLKEISAIERSLADCQCDSQKRALSRSLRRREKRLDQSLTYQDLHQLAVLCNRAGIQAKFI